MCHAAAVSAYNCQVSKLGYSRSRRAERLDMMQFCVLDDILSFEVEGADLAEDGFSGSPCRCELAVGAAWGRVLG